MKARWIGFGEIEVAGTRFDCDIVIDKGRVSKRHKGPSKAQRHDFGHTPLSVQKEIPWGGKRLIIGTGAYGSLPVMPEVRAEAARRGIELVEAPTELARRLLRGTDSKDVCAVLHVTC
jgi:hypothetical protein